MKQKNLLRNKKIFQKILKECMEAGLVDESVVFVDSTHVKARANSKKYEDVIVEEQALWYEKELREEIDRDREAHGKKPLKDEPEEPQNNDEEPKPPKDSEKGKPNPNTTTATEKGPFIATSRWIFLFRKSRKRPRNSFARS